MSAKQRARIEKLESALREMRELFCGPVNRDDANGVLGTVACRWATSPPMLNAALDAADAALLHGERE